MRGFSVASLGLVVARKEGHRDGQDIVRGKPPGKAQILTYKERRRAAGWRLGRVGCGEFRSARLGVGAARSRLSTPPHGSGAMNPAIGTLTVVRLRLERREPQPV